METEQQNYNNLQEQGLKTGGVRMIPIDTPKGKFNVWTKQIGNNPRIKVLLLHGGPGCTHEYFHSFESFLPKEGIQFYYYDQLGSYYSDRPQGEEYDELWDLDRFVEEVEQVRIALGLDSSNFYLLGHSWGGILCSSYALKYQQNLKGLIVSNMMMDCVKYDNYAKKTLGPKLPKEVFEEIMSYEAKKDLENPKYMEILRKEWYPRHVLSLEGGAAAWPYSVNKAFENINQRLYVKLQGPSEFGIQGDLAKWNVVDRLKELVVPTLFLGGEIDTMDPRHAEENSKLVQNGYVHICPKGTHMSMWDDQESYFGGLIKFLKEVDQKQS